MSSRNLLKFPFKVRLPVEPDFGQDAAVRSRFSRSALARSRRIGSQRSAKSHLEIFQSFGLSVQPTVSGGLGLRRLPEKSILPSRPGTSFSSMEQGGRSASSAPCGSWMRIIRQSPMRKRCAQSKASKQRITDQRNSPPTSLLEITA